MKLDKYLYKMGISKVKFARMLKVSRNTIHGYINGTIKPSLARCGTIKRLTDGMVCADDFI